MASHSARGFASGGLAVSADDVSRVVADGNGQLVVLAGASGSPFERAAPELSRAMIDAAIAAAGAGALPAQAIEAAAAALARSDAEDPVGWMLVARVAATVDIAWVGADQAWMIAGGVALQQTTPHSLRAVHGPLAPDLVTSLLARDRMDPPAQVTWQPPPGARLLCMSATAAQLPPPALLSGAGAASLTAAAEQLARAAAGPRGDRLAVVVLVEPAGAAAAVADLIGDHDAGVLGAGDLMHWLERLVVAHGADAVVDALPVDWRWAFIDHARAYANDTPVDAFLYQFGGTAVGDRWREPPEARAAIPLLRDWMRDHLPLDLRGTPFREEVPWPAAGAVAIGGGHTVYLLDAGSRTFRRTLDLHQDFFSHFAVDGDTLYILGWTDVTAVAADLTVRWISRDVAVDGITWRGRDGELIRLSAEMDPPGGWVDVELDAATGRPINPVAGR